MRDVTPVFPVADVDATTAWYRDVLGFDVDTFPENPPSVFAIVWRDNVEIFLQRVDGYRKPDLSERREGGVWDVYVRVTDLASLWDRVSALPGARGPQDRFYGQREIEIRDLNGYVLVFAEETNGGRS